MPVKSPKKEDPICPECWPTGWPEGARFSGCVHGDWEREIS